MAVLGVGMAAFAAQASAGDGREIPLEKRGMILGTMAHLKGVKLRAVAKLPDYVVNNDEIRKWDQSAGWMYDSTTPLDIMTGYHPAD